MARYIICYWVLAWFFLFKLIQVVLNIIVIVTFIIVNIVIMNRKMITTDINVYFMITGNMLVVVHCLSVTLRTLNGPLPIYAALFFRWNKKAEKIK